MRLKTKTIYCEYVDTINGCGFAMPRNTIIEYYDIVFDENSNVDIEKTLKERKRALNRAKYKLKTRSKKTDIIT